MNDSLRFTSLQSLAGALKRLELSEPHLVIDLDQLDANCAWAKAAVAPGRAIRLVQKSLPALGVLRYVAERISAPGTPRLMVFHRPFLNHYALHWPEAELLLGKPMPVAAAAAFYRELATDATFVPERQLQWLIDAHARLLEYQALARQLGRCLQVSIEIDVGMHRGGLQTAAELGGLLAVIAADPEHLRFSGFMGYDAHVAKAPLWTSPAAALARANARYAEFIAVAQRDFPALWHDKLCLNGAGSPSFSLHGADTPLNELAIGSALVKPTDFDCPTLTGVQPAAVIAAPILKRSAGVTLPYLERISGLLGGQRDSLFLYGGRWMARPAWPLDMRENPLYGLSSNQQLMTVPRSCSAQVGDVALLRPTQSEAVLLQFGDLLGVRRGAVESRWAVDPV